MMDTLSDDQVAAKLRNAHTAFHNACQRVPELRIGLNDALAAVNEACIRLRRRHIAEHDRALAEAPAPKKDAPPPTIPKKKQTA